MPETQPRTAPPGRRTIPWCVPPLVCVGALELLNALRGLPDPAEMLGSFSQDLLSYGASVLPAWVLLLAIALPIGALMKKPWKATTETMLKVACWLGTFPLLMGAVSELLRLGEG